MKDLIQQREFNKIEMTLVEAIKEIEDLKDYIEKLNKINAHLVNELMIETGLKSREVVNAK